MRKIVTLAAFVAALFFAPACAQAQIGQIDGRIASKFGGEIDTSSKANGYVLTYQASTGKWIAASASGGSVALDDLTDVTITSAASGNVLRYNGSAWVNATTSTVLDTVGSTRGSVLYRGASGWAALTPGTSGLFLKSNGAGADPSWASAGGGGGGSFDPAAATVITFADGLGNAQIIGPTDNDLHLESQNGANAILRSDGAGWAVLSSGPGGDAHVVTENANTSVGAILIQTGVATGGDSGQILLETQTSIGGNANGGPIRAKLADKTGSGTAGYFSVENAASATVFKVAYDGTLTFTANSTGSGTCTLGANSPALGTPTTWQKVTLANGHTGYIPVWE